MWSAYGSGEKSWNPQCLLFFHLEPNIRVRSWENPIPPSSQKSADSWLSGLTAGHHGRVLHRKRHPIPRCQLRRALHLLCGKDDQKQNGDNPPNEYDKIEDAFARDQNLFSRTLTILLRFCFARGIAIPYEPLAADIPCPKANFISHILPTLH